MEISTDQRLRSFKGFNVYNLVKTPAPPNPPVAVPKLVNEPKPVDVQPSEPVIKYYPMKFEEE